MTMHRLIARHAAENSATVPDRGERLRGWLETLALTQSMLTRQAGVAAIRFRAAIY